MFELKRQIARALKKLMRLANKPLLKSGLGDYMIRGRRVRTWIRLMALPLFSRLFPNPLVVNGRQIYYGPTSRTSMYAYLSGDYESATTELVSQLLTTGDTAIDVGANVGYFTLLFADHVLPTGHVMAFEPHPETAAYLRRTVEANDLGDRVSVIEKAVAAETSTQALYFGSRGSNTHSLYRTDRDRSVEVEVTSLDRAWKESGRVPVRLVKIDVEGGEEEVLAGMRSLAAHSPDLVVIFELNYASVKGTGERAEALLAATRELGLKYCYTFGTRGELHRARTIADLQLAVPRFSYANIVASTHAIMI